ncbi:dienelactone hydrolase family protein [Halomicrobium urmianum]|uniref:dienelactone hydrolase family protein n=1 Tax=Halomicrobium urmianum TaxID=1586233 RepID=UPI001CD9C784|nr:dienelactone hydrolase family protein [Halomicrobium urmianum]
MPVAIPGGRDVRGTLDGDEDADAVVVACPPHPQHGGSRSDERLRAVSDALVGRAVACLRFDYGPWDEGRGEAADAENALAWARNRFDRVGLFGYSFGGAVALAAAERADPEPDAVSVLAPAPRAAGIDAEAALTALSAPLQVVYGERDETADWEPLVDLARERGAAVEAMPADHFFAGQSGRVGEAVGAFLAGRLADE